ncbi:MAG: class I SAM-dependent methyltransferase [Legionella sp.]|jgi:hypothetical protein
MYDYESGLTSAQIVSITDKVLAPPNYKGETSFSMPDQIVNFCINQYGLANDAVQVLDPMCGLGTIPRVINSQGGHCIGIEIDESRFNAALSVSHPERIQQGDFLQVELPEGSFDCIFTSIPFDWFKDNSIHVNSEYAKKIKSLLTDEGFVLLDSVPLVERSGLQWPVGLRQCAYLEKNGFSLVEIIKFHNDSEGESIIMKFIPN